jgi:hypothetical protein
VCGLQFFNEITLEVGSSKSADLMDLLTFHCKWLFISCGYSQVFFLAREAFSVIYIIQSAVL